MDASAVLISKASLRDLRQLRALERLCFSKDDAWPLIQLIVVLIAPGTVRLKMEADGEMVAFLAGEIEGARRIGWITTIGVLPDWRQKGLAARLLAAGESALGTNTLRLTVRAGNTPAINLYEKAGYRQIGRIRRYYVGEDGLVLEKTNPGRS